MSIATPITRRAKPALRPKVPDFCPACDATDEPFEAVAQMVEQEFRGETLTVATLAHRCRHCGFEVAPAGALENLRRATTDAYRIRRGLLSPAEIVARRRAMGMTQRAFAHHVGVGIASLQRWEKGFLVQDEASDRLLREATRHTTFIFEAVSGLIHRREWQESIQIESQQSSLPFGELVTEIESKPSIRRKSRRPTTPDPVITDVNALAIAA